ncbi:hypothetical protein UY3_10265 [Chelonia mydas]|uniref:Uncharacterized protein n=1 Tax=Chelonia mydas TaxID=8469 RepID=M7B3U0_CHEMY|nr:hypothetical protein UY3_10265 [Chelonia mydas]
MDLRKRPLDPSMTGHLHIIMVPAQVYSDPHLISDLATSLCAHKRWEIEWERSPESISIPPQTPTSSLRKAKSSLSMFQIPTSVIFPMASVSDPELDPQSDVEPIATFISKTQPFSKRSLPPRMSTPGHPMYQTCDMMPDWSNWKDWSNMAMDALAILANPYLAISLNKA